MDWDLIRQIVMFALNCIGIGVIAGIYIGYRVFAAKSPQEKA